MKNGDKLAISSKLEWKGSINRLHNKCILNLSLINRLILHTLPNNTLNQRLSQDNMRITNLMVENIIEKFNFYFYIIND